MHKNEDPYMLEEMLDDAMLDLHDAWNLNASPEYIRECQQRIEELRERVNFAWQDEYAQ